MAENGYRLEHRFVICGSDDTVHYFELTEHFQLLEIIGNCHAM